MIRGVNRRFVEVTKTDSEYFERVFFIVREDKLCEDDRVLRAKADEYIRSVSDFVPPPVKKKRRGHKINLAGMIALFVCAASVVGMIVLFFNLIF